MQPRSTLPPNNHGRDDSSRDDSSRHDSSRHDTSRHEASLTGSARGLGVRKRDDLVAVTVRHRNESAVVVKDPLAMRYTRLRDDEFFILSLLDGKRSLDQICKRYSEKFAPRSVKPVRLNDLLFRFHENGLLVSSPIGQGLALSRRAARKKRERIQQALLSPLFIRFPGVDPDRFLNATQRFVRPLLHPVALAGYLLIALSALFCFASHIDLFIAETTDMNRWFRFESIVVLGCVIGTTKIIHELGHAYVCKHFGGECHTIGPMLMLFSPALYCDTTDSWLLASRWQRAAVGAAGIGVELVMASIATFVWLSTPAGLIHFAAMNVMLVCSISTLMFNANPLLRYDGYYVLSDLCDVPNLAQRSQRLLSSTLTRCCLIGGQSNDPIQNPARSAMLTYAAMAWGYRWLLTLTLLYIVSRMLHPVGLESIGILLGLFAAAGALYSIAKPVSGFMFNPLKRRKIEMRRLMMTGVAVAMAVAVLTYPLPARVSAVATLTPSQSQSVFAAVAGFVEMSVKPGQRVSKGDLIVKLRNPAIELDYVSASGKVNNQRTLVEALKLAELNDASVSERLPAAKATLDDLVKQYEMHRGRKDALEIRASRSGIVLPGDSKPASEDDEDRLSEWIDFATDEKNLGCFVSSGTEICRVADEGSFEAELVLPQSVAKRVQRDSHVRLSLASMPGDFHEGTVVDISRAKMSERRGDIDATEATSALTAGTTALDVSYLVRVRLEDATSPMLAGQQGDALISTAPKSIAERVYLTPAGILRLR